MGQAIQGGYDVPAELRWDAEIAKSLIEWAPYELGGLRPTVDGRRIHVAGVPADPLAEAPEAILERLVAGLVRGFRDLEEQSVDSHRSSRAVIERDMFEALLAGGDLVPAGLGDFAYRGRFLEAIEHLDALVRGYALSIGASEEAYPVLIPAASLRRAGHLNSFPHHALFVAPVRFDAGSIAEVRGVDSVRAAVLAPPESVLAPTVCYHCFQARIDRSDQREEIVTALNLCHRHEPALTGHTLERLTTFRMRELVFFGTPASVAERLDACFAWFLERLRGWDVGFRATTANDAFFANSSDSKRAFQTALQLKREVRLHVPSTDRWIAVGSFNNHRDSLVKAFGIEGVGADASLASACVGFGYDRLVYALFCAFGDNLDAWPAELGGRD